MTKHKPVPSLYPAPWSWDGEFPIQILDANRHVVCGDMMPSGEANARLIAAAPKLLEAAKHAAMEWRLHGQLTDSCRVLEAAIAEAEG